MRGLISHPRSNLQVWRLITCRARNIESPGSIRRAHDAPRVTRGFACVQEDRTDGAPAGGFFVLVSPSPVISETTAPKKIGLFFRRRRIVYQHHENLAAI